MSIPHAARFAFELGAVCAQAGCDPPRVTLTFADERERIRFMAEVERRLKPLLHPAAHNLIEEERFQVNGIVFEVRP